MNFNGNLNENIHESTRRGWDHTHTTTDNINSAQSTPPQRSSMCECNFGYSENNTVDILHPLCLISFTGECDAHRWSWNLDSVSRWVWRTHLLNRSPPAHQSKDRKKNQSISLKGILSAPILKTSPGKLFGNTTYASCVGLILSYNNYSANMVPHSRFNRETRHRKKRRIHQTWQLTHKGRHHCCLWQFCSILSIIAQ